MTPPRGTRFSPMRRPLSGRTLPANSHAHARRSAQSGGSHCEIRWCGSTHLGTNTGPEPSMEQTALSPSECASARCQLWPAARSVFSFIHVHDAATAFIAAMNRRSTGSFNIVDDEPAPVSTRSSVPGRCAWDLGAKRPFVCRWSSGLLPGVGVSPIAPACAAQTTIGARLQLGWSPRYPSWREGFKEVQSSDHVSRVTSPYLR